MSQVANNLLANLGTADVSETKTQAIHARDARGQFVVATNSKRSFLVGLLVAGGLSAGLTAFVQEKLNLYPIYTFLNLDGHREIEQMLPSPLYARAVLEGLKSDEAEEGTTNCESPIVTVEMNAK